MTTVDPEPPSALETDPPHVIGIGASVGGSSRLSARARQTAHDALASAAVVRDLLSSPGDGGAW